MCSAVEPGIILWRWGNIVGSACLTTASTFPWLKALNAYVFLFMAERTALIAVCLPAPQWEITMWKTLGKQQSLTEDVRQDSVWMKQCGSLSFYTYQNTVIFILLHYKSFPESFPWVMLSQRWLSVSSSGSVHISQALRTRQLLVDLDGGRPKLRLREPQDLFTFPSSGYPFQGVRWPLESEVIEDAIQHIGGCCCCNTTDNGILKGHDERWPKSNQTNSIKKRPHTTLFVGSLIVFNLIYASVLQVSKLGVNDQWAISDQWSEPSVMAHWWPLIKQTEWPLIKHHNIYWHIQQNW